MWNRSEDPPDRVRSGKLRITAVRAGRGKMVATIDVEFSGLAISNVAICRGPSGLFVAMPKRPLLDGDLRQRRDENGKPIYEREPVVRWVDPERQRQFQATVLAQLRADHPGVLSDAEPQTRLFDRERALADLL
jgi:DNA-binding cell septation regulator SpoVG